MARRSYLQVSSNVNTFWTICDTAGKSAKVGVAVVVGRAALVVPELKAPVDGCFRFLLEGALPPTSGVLVAAVGFVVVGGDNPGFASFGCTLLVVTPPPE
jgi:hypothetical protein